MMHLLFVLAFPLIKTFKTPHHPPCVHKTPLQQNHHPKDKKKRNLKIKKERKKRGVLAERNHVNVLTPLMPNPFTRYSLKHGKNLLPTHWPPVRSCTA